MPGAPTPPRNAMETEDGDAASTSDVPGVRHDLRPEDFTGHVVIGRGK